MTDESIIRHGDQDLTLNVFGNGFELGQRMAKLLATSGVVPTMYQGSIPNCLIALDIANRIGIGVLAVMQKMYIVHGKPAFEATFVAAAVNACGRYTPIRCRCNGKNGDDYGYYAVATEKATGEELVGTTIDWRMVKAEGWDKDKKLKTGGVQKSKWSTLPEQMFKYRAMSLWQREFEPGITMGVSTVDEVEDIIVDIEKSEPTPRNIDDVIEANKKHAEASEKQASSSEPTGQNKAQRDIAEAKFHASAMDTEKLRVEVIDKASALWGDDAMLRLSQVMRKNGTSISDADFAALSLVSSQLDSMVVGGA
jgi:hypothetical protein